MNTHRLSLLRWALSVRMRTDLFDDHGIRTGAFDCRHIAARVRAAERVELVLPETGVCDRGRRWRRQVTPWIND